MNRKTRVLLVVTLSSFLIFSLTALELATAVDWPDYVPTDEDIDDYDVLWQNSTSIENYFDPDAANITTYASIWYQNVTENEDGEELTALLSLQIMDFDSTPWNEPIDDTIASYIQMVHPDFEGETTWDLMVYFLNQSSQGIEDVSEDFGWTNAVLLNFTGAYFEHLIIGTLDTKFIVTYALTLETEWFALAEEHLYDNYNAIATAFSSMISAFMALGGEGTQTSTMQEESTETVEPTSGTQVTDIEDLKSFTQTVGSHVEAQLEDFVISGYPLLIFGVLSALSIVRVLTKRKHEL